MANIELFCVLLGDILRSDAPPSERMFGLVLSSDHSVSSLKKLIKAEKNVLHGVDADSLTVWMVDSSFEFLFFHLEADSLVRLKLKNSIPSGDVDQKIQHILQNLSSHATRLLSSKRMSAYFDLPPSDHLHLIAQVQLSGKYE
jgi:hypothetical protein